MPRRKQDRKLVEKQDEKKVKETDKTIAVKPLRAPKTGQGPTNPAAIDRRKQFSGTDEPADAK
jgi:hypothetical protein